MPAVVIINSNFWPIFSYHLYHLYRLRFLCLLVELKRVYTCKRYVVGFVKEEETEGETAGDAEDGKDEVRIHDTDAFSSPMQMCVNSNLCLLITYSPFHSILLRGRAHIVLC